MLRERDADVAEDREADAGEARQQRKRQEDDLPHVASAEQCSASKKLRRSINVFQ